MGYYDDEEYFENYNYDYEERIEPLNLIEEYSEDTVSDFMYMAGLTSGKRSAYTGNMEELVFALGEKSEIYSSAEIRFIERVDEVFVYPDFTKALGSGEMRCRAIATKFDFSGHDALRACVSFEKIIDKALDGFNVFLFVTEDSVFIGSRIFDKTGKRDCALSSPITNEHDLEKFLDEFSILTGIDSFMDYYDHFLMSIMDGQYQDFDYEKTVMLRRGLQIAYIEDISRLEQDTGISFYKEKERYWRQFHDEPEESFISLLQEVEESLAFIKSNRVNTYEMLYEAEEMMRQAEEIEAENERLSNIPTKDLVRNEDTNTDKEAEALLDDPDAIIKLLKKRRGIT